MMLMAKKRVKEEDTISYTSYMEQMNLNWKNIQELNDFIYKNCRTLEGKKISELYLEKIKMGGWDSEAKFISCLIDETKEKDKLVEMALKVEAGQKIIDARKKADEEIFP